MTKEAKATEYMIEPLVKLLRSEAISDGGTRKKAEALVGKWIRLNETMFAFEEDGNITLIFIGGGEVGCACKAFSDPSMNVLCEHIIAFEDLESPPQLTIESPDCRWLREYLFGLGWYTKNGYLYPSLDSELQEDVPSKLDPVNEDHDLHIGVDVDQNPKKYTRACSFCGHIETGDDLDIVKQHIDEHRRTCAKNPANKQKSARLTTQTVDETDIPIIPDPVVKESLTTENATVAKNATVEKPPKEEENMEERSKMYEHPDGTEFETAEALLDYVDTLKETHDMNETRTLMAVDTSVNMEQTWSDEQIEVMKNTVAEKATPAEFAYFLNVAKYSGLNPFLREIYFMKTDKGQTSIITGRDGYLTIAKRDPRFQGIHSMEVCEKDLFEMKYENGIMEVSKHEITDFMNRGKIIGAWACGRMNGQDAVTVFASMSEYDKSGNAAGGKVWKQYTSSMMRKVAESIVLKRIAGISGLVTEAEIGGTELITLDGGE